MLYVLWGEDNFSLDEALSGIKNQLGDPAMLATNTHVMEGQKINISELKAIGAAAPFLAEKRLIVVKGLLERFESREGAGSAKTSTTDKQAEAQSLAECFRGFPPSTVVVMIDSLEVKANSLKGNVLHGALAGQADIRPFPTKKGASLSRWIEDRVSKLGGAISRQAINQMMSLVGGDLYAMDNEIRKLVAFTGGRRIEENDIREVVSSAREADIFALIDAVMDRQAGQAEQLLEKLIQQGVVPPQMLALIARQVQMMVQLKVLKAQKRPLVEIRNKLGLFNEFVWNKMYNRAETYTLERLKQTYSKLLDTDLAIKTGRLEGQLALNLLVATLCQ